MTLEDFFTINELENGLTTPDRVNELISKMQSEEDLVADSFCQATQQWSKVATVITATENKGCLDLFIQLNGLLFIDKWLKDAQKLNDGDGSSFLEELIISLLRALEKLQIDDKSSFSSGIMETVQGLVANNSHTVREKAKELCDNWMLVQDKKKIPQDAKNSDNVESRSLANSMGSDTKNQRSLDRVETSSKSTNDEDNAELNSESEGVGGSDDKNESEINFFEDRTDILERSTLSCPSEQAASIEVEKEADSQEQSCSTSEKPPGLDLNQEVCSEEVDNLASWAATAAQIPASTSVCRDVPEEPGIHNNSNQRSVFHLDLNVAEGDHDGKMVIVSGLQEESSVANPRKPERLQLDLNIIEDDQNGSQSPYHASSLLSSSSSSKKPINIDLNLDDQQPNSEDSVISIFGTRVEVNDDQQPNSEDSVISIFGTRVEVNDDQQPNCEDSVISIFGTRFEVNKDDHKPQQEPKFDFNHVEHLDSSMHYGHQNAMFYAMPMYGTSSHGVPNHTHTPYIVDSRGTPFLPQIMGSQSSWPFFVNMATAGSAPPQPPQHNFDLNTGSMINGGLRQFFPQQVNEQASSSSVLGKRHEPDSSWPFFPVNKRQQLWR